MTLNVRVLLLLLLSVAFVVSPFILPPFQLVLLNEVLVNGLLVMSLDLVMGYAGLTSFGHAAFFGVGAYTSAWILAWKPISFPLILAAAFIVNALLGAGIGFIAIQARGIYFAMITLAMSEVVHWTLYDLRSISGGDSGLVGITPSPISVPGLFSIDMTSPRNYFYLTVLITALSFYFARKFVNSPFGSVLKGIKENENRCRFIGYGVKRYKLIAVIFSSGLAGIAGALYSPLYGFASPHLMEFHLSGKIILMNLLGGMGTLVGPILGAFFLTFFESIMSSYIKEYLIFIGLAFVLIVIFLPHGIYGLLSRGLSAISYPLKKEWASE
jgi:branched-chain amino acid transport system permease protein